MITVFLATGNAHKRDEFSGMIHANGLPVTLRGADELPGGMPDVDESGNTLAANARLKGEALLERVPHGAWVLADDTGLLVDALDGAPGVHSARFAGPGANAAANNLKLLHCLDGLPMEQRTARFSCVLFFARNGGREHFFEGSCEGHIVTEPSGDLGFGYDPLFRPLGHEQTFAALGSAVKNSLSHRGRAFAAWAHFIRTSLAEA